MKLKIVVLSVVLIFILIACLVGIWFNFLKPQSWVSREDSEVDMSTGGVLEESGQDGVEFLLAQVKEIGPDEVIVGYLDDKEKLIEKSFHLSDSTEYTEVYLDGSENKVVNPIFKDNIQPEDWVAIGYAIGNENLAVSLTRQLELTEFYRNQ
jgi:hypothetical protein